MWNNIITFLDYKLKIHWNGILNQDEVHENGNKLAFMFVFFKFQQERRLTRAALDNETQGVSPMLDTLELISCERVWKRR